MFFELHNGPSTLAARRWVRGLAERARGLVTITEGLKRALVEVGVADDKLLVENDGVDLSLFDPIAERPAREASGEREASAVIE